MTHTALRNFHRISEDGKEDPIKTAHSRTSNSTVSGSYFLYTSTMGFSEPISLRVSFHTCGNVSETKGTSAIALSPFASCLKDCLVGMANCLPKVILRIVFLAARFLAFRKQRLLLFTLSALCTTPPVGSRVSRGIAGELCNIRSQLWQHIFTNTAPYWNFNRDDQWPKSQTCLRSQHRCS